MEENAELKEITSKPNETPVSPDPAIKSEVPSPTETFKKLWFETEVPDRIQEMISSIKEPQERTMAADLMEKLRNEDTPQFKRMSELIQNTQSDSDTLDSITRGRKFDKHLFGPDTLIAGIMVYENKFGFSKKVNTSIQTHRINFTENDFLEMKNDGCRMETSVTAYGVKGSSSYVAHAFQGARFRGEFHSYDPKKNSPSTLDYIMNLSHKILYYGNLEHKFDEAKIHLDWEKIYQGVSKSQKARNLITSLRNKL